VPYHDDLDDDAALGFIATAMHHTEPDGEAMAIYKAAQARHGITDAEIDEYIRTHTTV
jgi:hypothetical protein